MLFQQQVCGYYCVIQCIRYADIEQNPVERPSPVAARLQRAARLQPAQLGMQQQHASDGRPVSPMATAPAAAGCLNKVIYYQGMLLHCTRCRKPPTPVSSVRRRRCLSQLLSLGLLLIFFSVPFKFARGRIVYCVIAISVELPIRRVRVALSLSFCMRGQYTSPVELLVKEFVLI